MRNLWDREMESEVELIERLSPTGRLRLIVSLLEWTISTLPGNCGHLIEEVEESVNMAMDMIRSSRSYSDLSGHDIDIGERLFELSEDTDFIPLWQLFNALSYCLDVPPSGMTTELATETMAACYDVVRDCAGVTEFPLGTPEKVVLTSERDNPSCWEAILRQKEMIREAFI